MRIEENYSLRKYNTFAIDVCCKYFVEVGQENELLDFVADYELNPEEILILGGGSNFLFTEDFDGTVIYPLMSGIEVIEEDEECVHVRVGAGVVWDDFVAWAVGHDYGGVENLSLIPGHVGASPVQNIGAYGMEAAEVICQVEAVELEKARKVTINAADCCFAYRDSIFKRQWKNKYIVTYVHFRLDKRHQFKLEYGTIQKELERMGGEIDLRNVRQAVINIRNAKLPDVEIWPNAGSFFKNPLVHKEIARQLKEQYPEIPLYSVDEEYVKVAAGWMIEQAGWKGRSIGQAGVHDKQALVLVNRGNASGLDIVRLANEVKKSVFIKFNVLIEPEVNVI